MVEIIHIIATHLNSSVISDSYEEVGVNAGFQIGTIGNGTVTGLMGNIYDGTADLIA